MTPKQQAKLDAIKAECRKAIELGEKATEGPWIVEAIWGNAEAYGVLVRCGKKFTDFFQPKTSHDSNFIVHSREFSPLAAQALLTAIEAHEVTARESHCTKETERAHVALETIINNWNL